VRALVLASVPNGHSEKDDRGDLRLLQFTLAAVSFSAGGCAALRPELEPSIVAQLDFCFSSARRFLGDRR
jgi:hypothetical protein